MLLMGTLARAAAEVAAWRAEYAVNPALTPAFTKAVFTCLDIVAGVALVVGVLVVENTYGAADVDLPSAR